MRRRIRLVSLLCTLTGALALITPSAIAARASDASAVPPASHGWVLVKGTDMPGRLPGTAHGTALVRTIRSLSAANGRDVSAELGYTGNSYGMLRARAISVAAWEQFDLRWQSSTSSWVIYSTANNRYVSAELGYTGNDYGMLRARATAIGSWERFALYRNVGTGKYSLLSKANGRWVSAELGYTGNDYGMLRARATVIAAWEEFNLT